MNDDEFEIEYQKTPVQPEMGEIELPDEDEDFEFDDWALI